MMTIGALARATAVKVPTIRYYEEIGLLPPPERTQSNQRRYTPGQRQQLIFIRHARDLGLPIEAIRELLALSAHPEKPCTGADRIAADHLRDVQRRIASLQSLEAELKRMLDHHHGGTVGSCQVLQSLSDHSHCLSEH
jgi:DNA-binding transcriptional MerR regulator